MSRAPVAPWLRSGYIVTDEDDPSTSAPVTPAEMLAMIVVMVLCTLGLMGVIACIFIWSKST